MSGVCLQPILPEYRADHDASGDGLSYPGLVCVLSLDPGGRYRRVGNVPDRQLMHALQAGGKRIARIHAQPETKPRPDLPGRGRRLVVCS